MDARVGGAWESVVEQGVLSNGQLRLLSWVRAAPWMHEGPRDSLLPRTPLLLLRGGGGGGGDDDRAKDDRAVVAAAAPKLSVAAAAVSEFRATVALFTTRRAALLTPLFFYTGFSNPYQLDGFGDRFFRERVLGLELAVFNVNHCVSAPCIKKYQDDQVQES